MSNIPIIKFMFAGDWSVLNEALSSAPVYESENYSAPGDLTTALGMTQAGLVVASLRDKNDLIQLATLMKMLKRLSPATFVKVIVVNFSGDKQFEKAVAKLGILDMVEARIQTKALRFKIDFMMKSVNAHLKNVEANQARNVVKTIDSGKAQEKKSADLSLPQWKDALENENDIWLLKNEADCKKILTRWLVKFMGPSPYVAQWVDTNSPGVWRFDFKSEAGIFITGEGDWFYRGDQKPDFIWAENCWSFAGGAFELFYKEGAEIVSRLALKDKQLSIAKNSDYAKTKEQNIIESFDKDLVFKKELGGSVESDTVDKEAEIYKNLEGKGKTDSLKQNPLAGKSNTSHLNNGPLSMDLEPGANDLSGYLKGKSSSEAKGANSLNQPTGNNVNSGENLDMDSKNSHQAYYKNHNEAEKFEAKDIGHAIKKDGVSDNLKGKSSTDEVEGYLTSPDGKERAAKAKSESSSEMSGKSATDKLDGHLRSSSGTGGKAPDGKDRSKESKEATASEMSGKSATDKLNGHLSSADGKERSKDNKEAAASEMSGKSATDKLDGHLRSADGKERSKDNKEAVAAEMSGKSATEKLDGHLRSADGKERPQDNKEAAAAEMSGKSATEKLAGYLKSADGKDSSEATKAKTEQEIAQKNKKATSDFYSNDDLEGHASQAETNRRNASERADGKKQALPNEAAGATGAAGASVANEVAAALVRLPDPSKELQDSMETAVVTAILSQDLVKVNCKLDDHFDNTIIFTAKKAEWNVEKAVTLNLNFNYMGKDSNLKFNGNVSQVDADDEGLQYITVEISNENIASFNSFMKLYAVRQQKIDYFMKAAKGY